MSLREYRPFFTEPDDLMLAGRVLLALETGRLQMHAAEYMELSSWMTDTVRHSSTPAVLRIRSEGPPALRSIAENALYVRGAHDWALDLPDTRHAEFVWHALLGRLKADASPVTRRARQLRDDLPAGATGRLFDWRGTVVLHVRHA